MTKKMYFSLVLSGRRSGRWRAILIAFGRAAEGHSVYLIIIIMQMSDTLRYLYFQYHVFLDMSVYGSGLQAPLFRHIENIHNDFNDIGVM